MVPTKDPVRVAAGQIGARRRWGPFPRVVRLDSLTNEERALVLALIDAKKAPVVVESTSAQEVSDVHGITTPTVRG